MSDLLIFFIGLFTTALCVGSVLVSFSEMKRLGEQAEREKQD